MVVAGGWKLTLGKKQGPGGPPGAAMAAQKGGGAPKGGGGMGGPAPVNLIAAQS